MTLITTWTGREINPLALKPSDVDIEDIAHSLSMSCRFNGHCACFYSVAEHSILVSRLCLPDFALVGLLHDATEAYLTDVPSPLKYQLPNYIDAETQAQTVISGCFGIPGDIPTEVHHADKEALGIEMNAILIPRANQSADKRIRGLSPALAKEEFLARFRELTTGVMRPKDLT